MSKDVVGQIPWVPLGGDAEVHKTAAARKVRGAPVSASKTAPEFDVVLDKAIKEDAAAKQAAPTTDKAFAKLWAQQVIASTQQMLFSAFMSPGDAPANPAQGMMNLAAMAARMRDMQRPMNADIEPYRPGSTYDSIVSLAGKRYGLPEKLIHAVIKAESAYNPKAVSSAGAQGLMQLMPQTAEKLGVTNAFDPFQNVMGGSRYLRGLLDHFDGNLRSALAAYNWGPAHVDAKGTSDLPDETREYIKRIGTLMKEKEPK